MLRCSECQATADTFAFGWVSFYAQVPDEDPEPVLVTYCGRCARREAGSVLTWLTAGQTAVSTDVARAAELG